MALKDTLKTIKLHESLISMMLGAVLIIVVGIIAVNYFGKNQGETIPPIGTEENQQTQLPTIHVVKEGENLWTISQQYYGTGYNWSDIAQANDLANPGDINVGETLDIPAVTPAIALVTQTPSPVSTETPMVTGQIASGESTERALTTPTMTENQLVKTTYKVVAGDNLWKIAEKYYNSGYNWVDIANANDLKNPNMLTVNEELSIPDVEPKQPTIAVAGETNAISGATYTVVKGDNLWNIALRAYGDGFKWGDIAQENELENPRIIYPGSILRLPR
jgi:nucleoid-associated protein YgaU